jgi:nucleotide-binding universal stress UspA family protein
MDTQVGRPVVVGVDSSDRAMDAVRWGADEAARRRVPLRVVSAFSWTEDHVVGQPGLDERDCDILLEQVRKALAAAVDVATELRPELEVCQQLTLGLPINVLAAEARRAQLVVVGDRGPSRVGRLLVGSVAVALASQAACPIVVVRGRQPPATTSLPVVVGVDGSPVSEAAIAFGYQAAADRGVPLTAVHTWWDTDPGPATQLFREEDQVYEQELLAERLAGWRDKYPDVEVERIVARDRPAYRLLEQSANAQLVVVGSRGHGEFAGLILGSVGNALVHEAGCPVAIVRPDPAAWP